MQTGAKHFHREWPETETFSQSPWQRCCLPAITAVVLAGALSICPAATITYDTAPYWSTVSGVLGGMGPGQSSTLAETFVTPAGPGVILNDFSFYAESYYPLNGGIANLHLRAFVYSWSGNLVGHGGGAAGNPLYLGPSFVFRPPPRPNGWVPLTANISGGGLTLAPGQPYVMGFTLSNPTDYSASTGDIEFQFVPARNSNYSPPPIPASVDFGSGGAVWLNNSNNFAALNSSVWSTWGDIGVMALTAHFTVVPELSSSWLCLGGAVLVLFRRPLRRVKTSLRKQT